MAFSMVTCTVDKRKLDNICRLCLTDVPEAGHLQPIFPVRGGKITNPSAVVNKIRQCTSLKLEPGISGPRSICELCSVRLEDWYAFREQCLGTDEYLRAGLMGSTKGLADEQAVAAFNLSLTESATEQSLPSLSLATSGRLSLSNRRKSTFEYAHPETVNEMMEECDTVDNGAIHHSFETEPISSVQSSPASLLQSDWMSEYRARVEAQSAGETSVRPYKCMLCKKQFKQQMNLRRHIKYNHAREDRGAMDDNYSTAPESYTTEGARTDAPDAKQCPAPPAMLLVAKHFCEVCSRSFKMAAHLAMHKKTHQSVGTEQTKHQKLDTAAPASQIGGHNRTGRKTDIEPSDIIQLSDDEDDHGVAKEDATDGGGSGDANGYGHQVNDDELDDGFDEEEGSLKSSDTKNGDMPMTDPSSLAIVEIGADDEGNGDVGGAVPEKGATPPPPPPRLSPPVTMVLSSRPGPLSSKRRYITTGDGEAVSTAKRATTSVSPTPPVNCRQSFPGPVPQVATPFRCVFCQETFAREETMRAHMKTHQNDAAVPFRCPVCRKGFRYRQNYIIHVENQTCRNAAMVAVSVIGSNKEPAGALASLISAPSGEPTNEQSTTVGQTLPRMVAKKRAW
ncbi:sal-like protein 2 [Anopheles bellator]|uniref:sal-like protein 2 n=1 Tax=Anopheles bellator TaxID=139047 RepID=UPI0026488120|nr:sal-like protein 2 [Anopheles bellator]